VRALYACKEQSYADPSSECRSLGGRSVNRETLAGSTQRLSTLEARLDLCTLESC
jgi:hypothetical protein